MSSIEQSAPTTPAGTGSRLRRLAGPVAALAVGLAVLALAQTIVEPSIATSFSPRWWPQILGALICLLAIGLAIKEVAAPSASDELETPTRQGGIRIALVVASILGYGVLWYFIDFRVATLVLVAAIVAIIGGRGWKSLILFPIIVTAVLYVIFVLLLRVPL
jgi:hypothetical protein